MKTFEAIIFDMDGLLLDSERMAYNAFQQTCRQFELGDRNELYMQCIGTNADATKKILSEGLGDDVEFDHFWKICRATYHEAIATKGIPLKEGVTTLLEHISSLNIPAAIATSTQTDIAQTKLQNSGILDYFRIIIGGEQVRKSKPHPDIYLKAVTELAVNASKSLALDDSENGVKSASSAGLTVIQIPDLVQPSAALKQNGHIILDSLQEVVYFDFK